MPDRGEVSPLERSQEALDNLMRFVIAQAQSDHLRMTKEQRAEVSRRRQDQFYQQYGTDVNAWPNSALVDFASEVTEGSEVGRQVENMTRTMDAGREAAFTRLRERVGSTLVGAESLTDQPVIERFVFQATLTEPPGLYYDGMVGAARGRIKYDDLLEEIEYYQLPLVAREGIPPRQTFYRVPLVHPDTRREQVRLYAIAEIEEIEEGF